MDWKDMVSEEDAARVCQRLLSACGVGWRLNRRPSPNAPDGMPVEVDVWGRGFEKEAWPWRYPDWKAFLAGREGWVNSFESDYGSIAFPAGSLKKAGLWKMPGSDRVLDALCKAGSLEELELRLEATSR